MRSMRLNETAGSPVLVEKETSRPEPGRGEVLVRVSFAGITPTELAWYPTSHTRTGARRTGAVPAHEFSGEISAIGEGVAGLSTGDRVFGMNDWFADGALAEFCTTRTEWIAPMPQRLSDSEAASVPIGALTAWQGLFDRARLHAGESVLVHGGAGAVGLFAVQLARWRGAHVIATASARNLEFVRELGANEVLEYTAVRFEDKTGPIDVVFDAVGGDTLERS